MIDNPEELVSSIAELVSLPEVYFKVNEVLEDPDHDAKQLGNVIAYDPSLTARLLKIVNSAFYSLAVKIDVVSRAVSVVGEEDLRNLVLATSAVNTMNNISNELMNINVFWRHSVFTGIIARQLSRYCNVLHGERLFVAGLLHDIGKLALYYKEPEISQKVLIEASETDGVLYRAEEKLVGYTHAELGGLLMRHWGLTATLEEVIKYHHHPLQSNNFPVETSLVHIADCVVNAMYPGVEINEHMLDDMPAFEIDTLQITGIDLSVLPETIEQARVQASEVLQIITS